MKTKKMFADYTTFQELMIPGQLGHAIEMLSAYYCPFVSGIHR